MLAQPPAPPAPPASVITRAVAAALGRSGIADATLTVAWERTALRKRVAEYRLAPAEGGAVALIGKTYTKPERGAAAHALLEHLWLEGFGSGQFRVARPIAWLGEWNMLLVGRAAGRQLRDRVLHDPGDAAVGPLAAGWLTRLHALPAPDFVPQRLARASEGVGRFEAELLPALSRDARRQLDTLLARIGASRDPAPPRPVLLHGDFHPQNVFVDGDGPAARVTAIDVDHARVGDPAWDVGYLLGQMRATALERLGDDARLEQTGIAVCRHYLAGVAEPDREGFARRAARFEALTLVESLHYRRCILHLPPDAGDTAILRAAGRALDAAA